MVAAWISAEIGVGPSIESGSQTCSGNCALLPMAPMNRQMQITVISIQSVPGKPQLGQLAGLGEGLGVVQRAGIGDDQADAEDEAEVADAVDQEGLQVGEDRRRPLVPEADQQVGHQAHRLPAEEQLQEVVAHHEHQHREGEQRDVGEEALVARRPLPCSRWCRCAPSARRRSPRTSSSRSGRRPGSRPPSSGRRPPSTRRPWR